jgi:hypothetical protein
LRRLCQKCCHMRMQDSHRDPSHRPAVGADGPGARFANSVGRPGKRGVDPDGGHSPLGVPSGREIGGGGERAAAGVESLEEEKAGRESRTPTLGGKVEIARSEVEKIRTDSRPLEVAERTGRRRSYRTAGASIGLSRPECNDQGAFVTPAFPTRRARYGARAAMGRRRAPRYTNQGCRNGRWRPRSPI